MSFLGLCCMFFLFVFLPVFFFSWCVFCVVLLPVCVVDFFWCSIIVVFFSWSFYFFCVCVFFFSCCASFFTACLLLVLVVVVASNGPPLVAVFPSAQTDTHDRSLFRDQYHTRTTRPPPHQSSIHGRQQHQYTKVRRRRLFGHCGTPH